jgi:hypothetical protein
VKTRFQSLLSILKAAWFQPLSLSSENPVSKFAFKLNLYRYGEACLGEEMDEFGGGGGGGETHADFFASYGDTADDPDAYSWHEEEEAYRRYVREGMAEKEKQKRQPTGGGDGGGGGGTAYGAASAQQRATRWAL